MYEGIIKKLEKMKMQILDEIRQSVDDERDDLKLEIIDSYEHATQERNRELNLILLDREREKLNDINDALTRIEEGDYGICEECGEEIPLKRLNAMPFAKLCIACKSELEKLENTSKKKEDLSSLRNVPAMEIDEED